MALTWFGHFFLWGLFLSPIQCHGPSRFWNLNRTHTNTHSEFLFLLSASYFVSHTMGFLLFCYRVAALNNSSYGGLSTNIARRHGSVSKTEAVEWMSTSLAENSPERHFLLSPRLFCLFMSQNGWNSSSLRVSHCDGRCAINHLMRLRLDPLASTLSLFQAMPHLVTAVLWPSNTPSLLGSRPYTHLSWWEKTATVKFAIFTVSLVEHWDWKLGLEKCFTFEKYKFSIDEPRRVISFSFQLLGKDPTDLCFSLFHILNHSFHLHSNTHHE